MNGPLAAEREAVVEHARRLLVHGLVVGTAGNVSIRRGELVAITPSASDYEHLRPEDVAVVHVDGGHVAGDPPSTELPLHLAVYEASGAAAVVHTHSPYATALSTVIEELPAVHYTIVDLGGPVPVLPYRTPGSVELADQLAAALRSRSGAILANHGTATVGPDLARALERSVLLEWLAGVYHRARLLGEPRVVGDDELARMANRLCGYFAGRPPARGGPGESP